MAAGLKYSYDFDNNGTFEVANSASPTASFTYASAGTYTARGRVADKDGGFTDYTTTVTVTNPAPPTANAGPDRGVNEGQSFQFQGSGTGTGSGMAGPPDRPNGGDLSPYYSTPRPGRQNLVSGLGRQDL